MLVFLACRRGELEVEEEEEEEEQGVWRYHQRCHQSLDLATVCIKKSPLLHHIIDFQVDTSNGKFKKFYFQGIIRRYMCDFKETYQNCSSVWLTTMMLFVEFYPQAVTVDTCTYSSLQKYFNT